MCIFKMRLVIFNAVLLPLYFHLRSSKQHLPPNCIDTNISKAQKLKKMNENQIAESQSTF